MALEKLIVAGILTLSMASCKQYTHKQVDDINFYENKLMITYKDRKVDMIKVDCNIESVLYFDHAVRVHCNTGEYLEYEAATEE